MPSKQYEVVLDQDQRDYLSDLISSGVESAKKRSTSYRFSLFRTPGRTRKMDPPVVSR